MYCPSVIPTASLASELRDIPFVQMNTPARSRVSVSPAELAGENFVLSSRPPAEVHGTREHNKTAKSPTWSIVTVTRAARAHVHTNKRVSNLQHADSCDGASVPCRVATLRFSLSDPEAPERSKCTQQPLQSSWRVHKATRPQWACMLRATLGREDVCGICSFTQHIPQPWVRPV